MKQLSTLFFLLVLYCSFTLPSHAATIILPTSDGKYISWNDASSLTDGTVQSDPAELGSTGSTTKVSFNVRNTIQQDYIFSFSTGSKKKARLNVVFTNSTGMEVFNNVVTVTNTGSWTPSAVHSFYLSQLPAGRYTLSFKVVEASGYAGNWGRMAFSTIDSYDKAPGTLTLDKGIYQGPRNEGSDIGFITSGGTATYSFIAEKAGVYSFVPEVYRYNSGGTMNIIIKDASTDRVEVHTSHVISPDAPAAYTAAMIGLPGRLSAGLKTMTLTFSGGSGYICNYRNPQLSFLASELAKVDSVSVPGHTVAAGRNTDWICNLPMIYTDKETSFSVSAEGGTLRVSAKNASGDIAVTDRGDGSYSLPTPSLNTADTVTIEMVPDSGAACFQKNYTLRIFHIGEVRMSKIQVDGIEMDIAGEMNQSPYSVELPSKIYTAVPVVKGWLDDGTEINPSVVLEGTQAVYTFDGRSGSKERVFTLKVDGIHLYAMTDKDEKVDLRYTSAQKTGDGTWDNGLYSLSGTKLDGWENSSFKMNSSSYTINVPRDVVVRQLVFKDLKSNYVPDAGAGVTSVTSGSATVYLPDKHSYGSGDEDKYDLIVNIENHQCGEPVSFAINGGGQPTAWFELVTEHEAVTTEPVLKSRTITSTDHANHAVVIVSFDREMKNTTATVGTQSVTAEGGSSKLYFSLWNLNYDTDYSFVIPAGAASDNYGNSNAYAVIVNFHVGSKAQVQKRVYDYVVSTTEELISAVAAVNSINTSAEASRKTIFVRNGSYDLENKELSLTAYNVSVVGESEDGVILHGVRDGITNPVFNINEHSGIYLQDFTVRNDYTYGTSNKRGVAVAVSGGNKAVMKNIRMLSYQDTQVTGARAYYEDCDIHGTVDFICGGGDHYYYRTNLVLEDGGSVIAAPSTSSVNRWGYVFQECNIKAAPGVANASKNYSLGRPWQNEPRIYYLNTKMSVLPSDGGWGSMGRLPTHFYEYNSIDSTGATVNLALRKNSSTSTNTYKPVLTSSEASAFTLHNVLGGTDSWLPAEETVEEAAPQMLLKDDILSWNDVDGARCYVIFKNGKYMANQTAHTYEVCESGVYTVRAANLNGGLGEISNSVIVLKIDSEGWTTFSSSEAVTFPPDVSAYIVSSYTDNTAYLTKVISIPVNTGVVVHGSKGFYALGIADGTETVALDYLVGTADGTHVVAEAEYALETLDNGPLFHLLPSGVVIPSNKADLRLPLVEDKTLNIKIENTAGIDSVRAVPVKDVKIYNLSGQRMKRGSKGILVLKGRKIINRGQ